MYVIRVILWCLPELLAVVLVVGGPLVSRTIMRNALVRAAEDVCFTKDREDEDGVGKVSAVAYYYLDFSLAVIGLIVFPFGVTKFFVFHSEYAAGYVALVLGLLCYFLISLVILYILFVKTSAQDYQKGTDEKINVFGIRRWKWGRVSGTSGLLFWWCRLLPSIAGLGLSVFTAVSIIPR